MARKPVKVGRDHVQTLINASPQKAIEELIWNGLDAGGSGVEVRFFGGNGLGSVSRAEVVDRGTGIAPDDLDVAFGMIGQSLKTKRKVTPEGRALHGREGKGRLKALAICPIAVWETVFETQGRRLKYSVTLRRDDPEFYEDDDPTPTSEPTGTRVVLDEIDKGHISLTSDETRAKLAESFACYLSSYPGARITYDGRLLDTHSLIRNKVDIPFVDDEGSATGRRLVVIEWNFRPDARRLHICDERGFSYHDMLANVQGRGIEYTAYFCTPAAAAWAASGRLSIPEMDNEIKAAIDEAKDHLRAHIRSRLAAESATVVEEWKKQEIYPYDVAKPDDPLGAAEREVFDIVATQVNDQHPTFEKTDLESKRLTLALIRQALESNPSGLTRILREVISLPEEERDALIELLDRAPLSNLIRAGKVVADRLDTIHAFEHIIFHPDWKSRLLERTQLHRLLVHELWLLGEEYSLGADDDGLKHVLEAHLTIMKRTALAPGVDVKLIDDTDGIPDLMLYRRRKLDRDRFEHLVVELKRPRDTLGTEETVQIKKYAFTVAKDERFDTRKCSWQFVLLGNSFDEFVKEEASSSKLPEGCIHEGSNLTVWVRTWADVFNDARARYEFFREKLAIEASHERGMSSMTDKYGHLLTGRGMRKKKDQEFATRKQRKG